MRRGLLIAVVLVVYILLCAFTMPFRWLGPLEFSGAFLSLVFRHWLWSLFAGFMVWSVWHAFREYENTGAWHAFALPLLPAVLVFGVWLWWAISNPFRGTIPVKLGPDQHLHWYGGSFTGLLAVVGLLLALFVWRVLALERQRREYADHLRESQPPPPSSRSFDAGGKARLKDEGLL